MDAKQALRELEAAGTAQNRKVYARHGVKDPMFGVSYAHQGKLRKRIGTDHALAGKLWASGNHDARVLATMVADPAALTAKEADAWVKELRDYVVTDAFSKLVAASPLAHGRAERWIRSPKELVASAGWNVLAQLSQGGADLDEAALEEHLATIEATIHGAPNRARHAMNNALICIGLRSPGLRRRAVAAAKRIGPVEVDHGETGCRTPDAVSYIAKAAAHREEQAAKKRVAEKKVAKKPAAKKKSTRKKAAGRGRGA